MSNEEAARRARAKKLRKEIAERLHPAASEAAEDHPEMLPNESPNEYIERRSRELKAKKARGSSPRRAD